MMRPMKLSGENFIFGTGSLAHLQTLKGKKAVIYYSSSLVRNNKLKDVVEHLKIAEIQSVSELFPYHEPDFEDILKGAQVLLRETPDWIIAVGGGSLMDAAKAMWIYYEYPEINTIEKMVSYHNSMPPLRKKARLACIPTTAGTASEVSRSLVVTNKKNHVKSGVSDLQLLADVAILDPELSASLPLSLTAETSMDALTHAVEAYVSQRANILSDTLTLRAFSLLAESLPIVWKEPGDLDARGRLLLGSSIAGMGFSNVSLGIVHSISHAIGGMFKVPHGLLNAIILPYVVEFNSGFPAAKEKYLQLAETLRSENLAAALRELAQKLEIPLCLQDLIKEAEFMLRVPQLAQIALEDGCTKTNPVIPTLEQMIGLMDAIYRGIYA